MANFPGSAPSFSNKTPGQTIASAHINAIQDEVVAIGAGYLGGTAPMTSSNATMAHVSAGTSTFAGIVVQSAISTLTITTLGVTTLTPTTINANSTSLVVANIATAVTASSGAAGALPGPPAGYIKLFLNGSPFVIPYFNV